MSATTLQYKDNIMNLEDYTLEQRALWTPRQRQWHAAWKNGSVQAGAALLESLEADDEESTGQ
jgi:hypothetical protein